MLLTVTRAYSSLLCSQYNGTDGTLTCQEMSSHSLMPSPVWARGTLISLLQGKLTWKLRHCALESWAVNTRFSALQSRAEPLPSE